MTTYSHLEKQIWHRPHAYMGFNPEGDYAVLSCHRDSTYLDHSNWDFACEALHAKELDVAQAERFKDEGSVIYRQV